MTLEELKEVLATYGVNPEERSAPVVLASEDGTTVPITAAVVDWDYTNGNVVLLSSALALTRRDYSNLWSMAQRSYNEAAAAGLDEIAAYFRSLVIRLEAVQS